MSVPGEEIHRLTVPLRSDPQRALLVKLIIAEGGGSGGGGGGGIIDVFSGHYGGLMPTTPTTINASSTAAINYDLDPPFQTWKWDNVAKNWGG